MHLIAPQQQNMKEKLSVEDQSNSTVKRDCTFSPSFWRKIHESLEDVHSQFPLSSFHLSANDLPLALKHWLEVMLQGSNAFSHVDSKSPSTSPSWKASAFRLECGFSLVCSSIENNGSFSPLSVSSFFNPQGRIKVKGTIKPVNPILPGTFPVCCSHQSASLSVPSEAAKKNHGNVRCPGNNIKAFCIYIWDLLLIFVNASQTRNLSQESGKGG